MSSTGAADIRGALAMATDNVINQRDVTIEIYGRTITGVYTVWSGVMTVSTAMGTKTTPVGGSGTPSALDDLARLMLCQLALEGEA